MRTLSYVGHFFLIGSPLPVCGQNVVAYSPLYPVYTCTPIVQTFHGASSRDCLANGRIPGGDPCHPFGWNFVRRPCCFEVISIMFILSPDPCQGSIPVNLFSDPACVQSGLPVAERSPDSFEDSGVGEAGTSVGQTAVFFYIGAKTGFFWRIPPSPA
jgi:hypothetical protein